MPQAQPRQQLTLQDSKMLQRQLLLKQLQELQKHRQFPELSDGRQQNYLNQQSENYMPANTSFMPHGAPAAVQGFSNGNFSQPHTQDLFLANNYNQYSHLQGLSPDSAIAFSKNSNNQEEKPAMQTFYGKPFLGINQNIISNGNTAFGQVRNEGFQQINRSAEEYNSRQDQHFQGKTIKIDPSQGVTTLDPLEQKILFNMDGNGWNSSFGRNAEDYSNKLECSDYLSSFPSLQSGSWSALMQSAVAESSSENGAVQEEWSGLSYQNTELSMDNQNANNADIKNQQNNWVDNPLGGSHLSSGFSGFQFQDQQREATRSDSSHESVQQSPKISANWLNNNSQQNKQVKESQPNHMIQPPMGNAFPFQGFQISDGNAEEMSSFAKSHDQQGNHNVKSVASYMRNQNQNQNQNQYPSAAAVDSQFPLETSPNISNKTPPFDLFIPKDPSQSNYSHDQNGQHYSIMESSSLKPPNLWPNALPQSPPWVSQDQHKQKNIDGNLSHEPCADLTDSKNIFHGKALSEGVSQTIAQTGFYHNLEPVTNNLSEENNNGTGTGTFMGLGGENQITSVSARDLEAFGRSLKPSNMHLNYSGPSEIKHELNSVAGPSTPTFVNPYAFRDANIQSIKPSAEEISRHDISISPSDHNVSNMALNRTDHSQLNMQMASWFKQYGALRNGQVSTYDRTAKNSTYPSPLGKNLENLENSENKTLIVPLDVTRDSKDAVKFSPSSNIPPDFGDTELSMIRSRKRKTATSDFLPWHMEVTESSKRLHSISMAETEWAKAVNRLVDKVDYEVKFEDMRSLLRPKKRLILTTQLMQLVFMPAPAAILQGKANLNFDNLAYFSAKLALGDACNLNNWSRNGSGFTNTSDNMMTESSKPSERASEKHFSTIVEVFTSRVAKLEADFLRLNKTASFSDVIMEYRELEKFSIINRFAKFHFRGQAKATETSTSSGSNSGLLKPSPQRYVLASRPRALPEKAPCFSL